MFPEYFVANPVTTNIPAPITDPEVIEITSNKPSSFLSPD